MLQNFTYKLNGLDKKCSNTNQAILNVFSRYREKKKTIENPSTLSTTANVSNSALSKFSKLLEYKNINIIIFLHNELIHYEIGKEEEQNENITKNKIKKVACLLNEARKIFFIGVSGSYIPNKDFSEKLIRLDKWVICNEGKYNQIGNSNLLNHSDVVIINSLSLQHNWMKKIIETTKSNIILLTNNKNIKQNKKLFVFHIESNEEMTFNRVFTIKSRQIVFNIYDELFKELIKIDGNSFLLKASSYKK